MPSRTLLQAARACTLLLAPLLAAQANVQTPSPAPGLAAKVDPFIGVDWGGNTFIGATLPYGMVKLGPDVETFDGRPIGFGYSSYGRVFGFSHTHLSGASGKYGNILVLPVTGPLPSKFIPATLASTRTTETAQPGYYSTTLARYNVRAELTASRRVGMHRYTFQRPGQHHLVIDLAHALALGTGWEDQNFLGAEAHLIGTRELRGVTRVTGGWNRGGEYKVFFNLQLDTPAASAQTWLDTALSPAADAVTTTAQPIGAIFTWQGPANQVVHVKVGISYISAERAAQNLRDETPTWNFDTTRLAAAATWNTELSKLQLTGVTPDKATELYTAMYHLMLMPVDRTGENPDWPSGPAQPYYDDYYAIWDTFRSSSPLLTLISPDRERDLIRSLIDISKHTGYLPDARSGNDTGRTQGGENANIMITDAYVKGLTGIDYPAALAAMVHGAEVPPADAQKQGRGGLEDYNRLGYITPAAERAGSRTVEYAFNDFAIAQLACRLNQPTIAAKYAARDHNFENLFDPNMEALGFKGFLRPRNADGTWAAPYLTVRGTWPDFMYEGDIWTYTLYAPHDMRRMIQMTGGPAEFMRRLDFTFARGHFDVTNEPGFLMPVLYNYALRPDKSADIIHLLLEKFFNTTRAGIPGNDDSGAMSSWLLFQTLGIYPVAGQDVYLIGTPSIPTASLALGGGRQLRIITHNLDPAGLNHYIQSATLNGQPLTNSWFLHNQIKDGATLTFEMGSEPSPTWGRTTPPPSTSDPTHPHCW